MTGTDWPRADETGIYCHVVCRVDRPLDVLAVYPRGLLDSPKREDAWLEALYPDTDEYLLTATCFVSSEVDASVDLLTRPRNGRPATDADQNCAVTAYAVVCRMAYEDANGELQDAFKVLEVTDSIERAQSQCVPWGPDETEIVAVSTQVYLDGIPGYDGDRPVRGKEQIRLAYVLTRFLPGYTESELEAAKSCTSMPGVEEDDLLFSNGAPRRLFIYFTAAATDEEMAAVTTRLEALEHVDVNLTIS